MEPDSVMLEWTRMKDHKGPMHRLNAIGPAASVVRVYFSPVPVWTSLSCCWKSTRLSFSCLSEPIVVLVSKGTWHIQSCQAALSATRVLSHKRWRFSYLFIYPSSAPLTCPRLIPVDAADLRCMLKWPQNDGTGSVTLSSLSFLILNQCRQNVTQRTETQLWTFSHLLVCFCVNPPATCCIVGCEGKASSPSVSSLGIS